ncbi:MAG: MmcQ/YjbR family DNA-binding protein [Ruminococcus sp.]|nr:MmcQ/YjbR family DNA-binding protein [Ruminococcus sp.]
MTQQILEYIRDTYGAEPEYLWRATPTNAALRNNCTGKWFAALIGNLPLSKLGVKTDKRADVLNLKCDPMISFTLVDNERIFAGYHMNKEHWISVRLDGCVPVDELKALVDMSYEIVDNKGKARGIG